MNFRTAIAALAATHAFAQDFSAATAMLPATATASNITVHAAGFSCASSGVETVRLLNDEICRLLSVTSPPPAHVAWFTNAGDWAEFSTKAGASVEGRGLTIGGAIAFLSTPENANTPLAHELVHHALKRTSAGPLPLWFEEGCAGHFSWLAVRNIASAGGRELVRTLPPLEPDDLLKHDALLTATRYPETAAAARAFYRQAEELIRYLHDTQGTAGIREISGALAADNDLRHCLESRFHYAASDIKMILLTADARATARQQR